VQLSCVIVDADNVQRQELQTFLQNRGVSQVSALARLDQLEPLLSGQTPPRLVIVHIDPDPQESLARLTPLIRRFQQTSFFVMSSVLEASLVLDAMHAGVKEFVTLPVNQQKFVAALERVAQLSGVDKRAKVLHFIPTMGGCGSTTIACNVAASLAKGGKTALLDLDLVRGGVASYFDLRPRYTIADVMDQTAALDMQLLDNALARHGKSGLGILSRPELPEDTQRVTQAGFGRLMGMIGRMFDYVVMDSMMSIDPVYAAAIGSADVNVVVMQLNVPSAKNAERFVGALRRMGIESSKMKIVVNRYVKKGWDIDPAEVERSLGLKISWMVPNDFKTAIEAINFGEPCVIRAPRAEISQSLTGLAQMLNAKASAVAA
jgi:pilus assembly protein CpaE